MDTNRNADDAVTPARPAGSNSPQQVTTTPLPEPADAAIQDGQAPAFVLPRNPIAAFFAGPPVGFWFFFWGEFAERCSYYGMRRHPRPVHGREARPGRGRRRHLQLVLHRRVLLPPPTRRLRRRPLARQILDDRRLLHPVHPRPRHPRRRELLVHGRRPVAAGDGQRRHQAQHLDAHGPDLRPAAAGTGEAPQRRLRHVLLLHQRRRRHLPVRHAGRSATTTATPSPSCSPPR